MTEVEFLKSLSIDYSLPPERIRPVTRSWPNYRRSWPNYRNVLPPLADNEMFPYALGSEGIRSRVREIGREPVTGFNRRRWLLYPRWCMAPDGDIHLSSSIDCNGTVWAECGVTDIHGLSSYQYTETLPRGYRSDMICSQCNVPIVVLLDRGQRYPEGF